MVRTTARGARRMVWGWGLCSLLLIAPTAAMAAGASYPGPEKLTPLNSMSGDPSKRPLRVLGLTCIKNLRLYAIDRLVILNASTELPLARRDAKLAAQPLGNSATGASGYDVIANGTFVGPRQGNAVPLGPLVRAGVADHAKYPAEADYRGAVAIRADGTLIVGRAAGTKLDDLNWRFAPDVGNAVRAAMGGGGLLIENGVVQPWTDLGGPQKFGGSLTTGQFKDACHSLIGIRDGQAYLIFAASGTGDDLQKRLSKAGFDSVVKFDGSSTCTLRDIDLTPHAAPTPQTAATIGIKDHLTRPNPTGFGVIVRREEMGVQRANPCTTPNTALPGGAPTISGTALSACFKGAQCTGRDAGEKAAVAFCRSTGYGTAQAWSTTTSTVLTRDIGDGAIYDVGQKPAVTGLKCGDTCADGSVPDADGICGGSPPPPPPGTLTTDNWAGTWNCTSRRSGRFSMKITGAGMASQVIGFQPNAGPYRYHLRAIAPTRTQASGGFHLYQGRNGPEIGHGRFTFTVNARLQALDTTHVWDDGSKSYAHLCKRDPGRTTGATPAPMPRQAPGGGASSPSGPARPAPPSGSGWQPIN